MQPRQHSSFSVLTLLLFSLGVHADDFVFDSSAIENTGQISAKNIDISQFNKNNNQSGVYHVSIRVNHKLVTRSDVNFNLDKSGNLLPEITVAKMHDLGIYFSDQEINNKDNYVLPGEISGMTFSFNTNKLLLDINIPQVALKAGPDDDLSVPVNQWDNGISALSLNYDFNGAQKSDSGKNFKADDQYIRLNSGLNIGAWRLRNTGTADKPPEGSISWDSSKTWIQRNIPALRGRLSLGDNSSDASLFDGIDYSGVSLTTDNSMYDDKAQGYAPVVRGIARTSNALVEISQNGNVIYKRYVPAGQFLINDLYPQTGGGLLKVKITEADGSEHHFTQAWGTVSAMQRQGFLKYSLNSGRTKNSNAKNENFSQLSFFYGLPADMTIFGGSFLTSSYHAFDIGYALGLSQFGSVSADIKFMQAHPYETLDTQGQNYRLQYVKNVPGSDTDFSMSWAFSPAPNYVSYPDAITDYDDDVDESSMYQKNQLQLSVNQPFDENNTVILSLIRTAYWYKNTEESLTLTDNLSIYSASLNVGWAWTQDSDGSSEQLLSLNLQIPFSIFSNDTWISLSNSLQRPGAPTQSVGLNGNALGNDALSWQLSATNGDPQTTTQDVSLDYKGSYGEYTSQYSHSSQQQSLSYQIKGSLIGSSYGLTAGQYFNANNAVALIKAEHAPGLKVENQTGVTTDFRGYTIVPYLQPYREDSITISKEEETDTDIELGNTSLSRVPTEGAIVLAEFTPHIGQKLLLTLTTPSGTSVPFGATVTAGEGSNEGIVDENGAVYLVGAPPEGTITAKWGDAGRECHAPYQIQKKSRKHFYALSLVCR